MPGTVTIASGAPLFGRAAWLRVHADGRGVGTVRQGGCLEVTVESGLHSFRVTSGGGRSKTVVVHVPDGGRLHLDAGVRQAATLGAVVAGLVCGGFIATGIPAIRPIPVVVLLLMVLGTVAIPDSLHYLRVVPTLPTHYPDDDSLRPLGDSPHSALALTPSSTPDRVSGR